MANLIQQYLTKISNATNQLVKHLITELGNSEYNLNADPKNNKGTVQLKMPTLGKVEFGLEKGAQALLKVKTLAYTDSTGQPHIYYF